MNKTAEKFADDFMAKRGKTTTTFSVDSTAAGSIAAYHPDYGFFAIHRKRGLDISIPRTVGGNIPTSVTNRINAILTRLGSEKQIEVSGKNAWLVYANSRVILDTDRFYMVRG